MIVVNTTLNAKFFQNLFLVRVRANIETTKDDGRFLSSLA